MVRFISLARDGEIGVFDSIESLDRFLEPWYFRQVGARVFDEEGTEYAVSIEGESATFRKLDNGENHSSMIRARLVERAGMSTVGDLSSVVDALMKTHPNSTY